MSVADVWLLGPHLELQGGVVSIVEALLPRFSKTQVTYVPIGRKPGETHRAWLSPLRDNGRLLMRSFRSPPDVVHLNPSFNRNSLFRDALLSATARVSGARQLIFFHGWEESDEQRARASRFWRVLLGRTLMRADWIIVLAPQFKEGLMEMGVPEDRIEVLPTLFDGDIFSGVTRRESGPPMVLFLSRMIEEKGVFELIDAVELLTEAYPDLRLVLAGEGAARQEAEQRVRTLGLQDRVSFPGFVRGQEKAQLLLDADVFALPTRYGEGCPVSLLEAMAAETAVLTTHAGGIAGVANAPENGVILEQVTAQTVAEGLSSLLSVPERLSRIARTNREQAWNRYEAGSYAKHLEEIYERLAR